MKGFNMKKLFAAFGFATLVGLSSGVVADPGGGCHFHGARPAAETVVIKCADQRRDGLVNASKLEPSWGLVKYESISLVDGRKGKEWRVVYKNPGIADKTKASLFMFFTPVGNFIAANHTGQ
jgi:hypothetical protein